MMNDILALDIETANFSHEIGGWHNTHLFEPSVAATWNGHDGTIYCNEGLDVDSMVKALHPRTLGDDLADHVDKGGKILGHNIKAFDLPVLRDALDCWTASDLMKSDAVIDTRNLVRSASLSVERVDTSLGMLTKHTFNTNKLMNSADAPVAWREGRYDEVAKYCLSDAKLTYDLYQFGKAEGHVLSRSLESGEVVEIEVDW